MNKVWKIGYVLCRQTGLSGLPGLRWLRNLIYCRYLGTTGVNIDDFVRIAAAHRNPAGSPRKVGPGLHVSRNADVDYSGGILFGKNVTISENAKIFTHDHVVDGGKADWRLNGLRFSPLEIGDNAWIGADALVLQSVRSIGEGAIVAAGSVVTCDVEPFMIVAGNPARPVRARRGAYAKDR